MEIKDELQTLISAASGIVLSVHNPCVRIAFPSGNSLSEVSILIVNRTKRDLEIKRLFNRTIWEKYLEPQPLIEGLYREVQN